MNDWIFALQEILDRHTVAALVTVVETKGSAPREAGAKMIVIGDRTLGTIGGGHLEYKAIEIARQRLRPGQGGERAAAQLVRFPLGPSLGQCCGGNVTLLCELVSESTSSGGWLRELAELQRRSVRAVLVTVTGDTGQEECQSGAKMIVTGAGASGSIGTSRLDAKAVEIAREMLERDASPADRGAGPRVRHAPLEREGEPASESAARLLFELVRPPDFNIFLFGAGHVGKALVSVLAGLSCKVTWIDSREDQFPERVPANVAIEFSDAPEYDVDDAPPGTYFLVMTHNHQLDSMVCERILKRGDFRYLGLIGSKSKRKRFEMRLIRRGVHKEALRRMICPIGVGGISGKTPSEIAIAVAAQILRVREKAQADLLAGTEPEILSA